MSRARGRSCSLPKLLSMCSQSIVANRRLTGRVMPREEKISDQTAPVADRTIGFGPFRLLPEQRLLREGEKPLRLGSRALDILIALVERPGELITKEELVAKVWPNTIVEEGNLRVHMAALRKALGEGQRGKRYVATVPGRGYRFVAPISFARTPSQPSATIESLTHNLPALLTRLVGRAEIVDMLVAQVKQRRFITIAGPGGIDTTADALAVSHALSASFRDGVRFVDLAPLTDRSLVPSALASVLRLAIRSDNSIRELVAFLRDKQMLLVLDSCEHVIGAAASMSEQALQGAPSAHILAPSRAALRADGERVHRLRPLDVPTASTDLTAAEAITYSAVRLFVERATESLGAFELTDADASPRFAAGWTASRWRSSWLRAASMRSG